MTQKSSAWHEQQKVKIGDYGEELVRNFLEEKRCVCYKPLTDASHPFDFLASRRDLGTFAVEVKTKPSRRKYPDTGFDVRHYKGYKQFTEEHSMNMFVFFVDVEKGLIYGNYLHELDKPRISNGDAYPFEEFTKHGGMIRYFPLEAVIPVRKLTDDEINNLKHLGGVAS